MKTCLPLANRKSQRRSFEKYTKNTNTHSFRSLHLRDYGGYMWRFQNVQNLHFANGMEILLVYVFSLSETNSYPKTQCILHSEHTFNCQYREAHFGIEYLLIFHCWEPQLFFPTETWFFASDIYPNQGLADSLIIAPSDLLCHSCSWSCTWELKMLGKTSKLDL